MQVLPHHIEVLFLQRQRGHTQHTVHRSTDIVTHAAKEFGLGFICSMGIFQGLRKFLTTLFFCLINLGNVLLHGEDFIILFFHAHELEFLTLPAAIIHVNGYVETVLVPIFQLLQDRFPGDTTDSFQRPFCSSPVQNVLLHGVKEIVL